MAEKPIMVDYETKLCSGTLQPLYDMVWDGLGESPINIDVRTYLQAQPVAPNDSIPYVGYGGNWLELTASLFTIEWGDIGGDPADNQSLVDYIDASQAAQDSEHIGLIIALG